MNEWSAKVGNDSQFSLLLDFKSLVDTMFVSGVLSETTLSLVAETLSYPDPRLE
jgi:hypothetical protein